MIFTEANTVEQVIQDVLAGALGDAEETNP